MKHIAVMISGSGSNLQAIIDGVFKQSIHGQIDLVISNKKDAYGLIRAKDAGIVTLVSKDQKEIKKALDDAKIDLIVLAGYLAILDETILKSYEGKILNIHPSLIPSFCGKGFYGIHVHEAAFKRGVKVSGATVHFVSEVVDGGPIVIQKAVDVSDCMSPKQMQEKILPIEHEILVQAVKAYCDDAIIIEKEGVKII